MRTLLTVLSLTAAATAQVWPGATWPTATPESQGLDGAKLWANLRGLPDGAGGGPLIVIANGYEVMRISDVTRSQPLFSCSKVITGMVAAQLIENGQIANLDELVPNTVQGAWGASYPGDSSYRMFMSMTSDYGLSPYHPSQTQYAYNNNGIDFYGESMGQRFFNVNSDEMDLVVQQSILNVTGSQDAQSFIGQWGGWFGGLHMSAQDFARIGLLLIRDGMWQNQRVLAQEFTDGLWSSQIAANALKYSNPGENSQFNQQAVTDILGGNWSYGLWRVVGEQGGEDWPVAAAEGFRGKRLMMHRKGWIPTNPTLELIVSSVPQLRVEGPTSFQYYEAVEDAVIEHPDYNRQALAVLFDDDHLGRLKKTNGYAKALGGKLELGGGANPDSRVRLEDATHDDLHIMMRVDRIPAGGKVGFTLREPTTAGGGSNPTTRVYAVHLPQNGMRIDVEYEVNGSPQIIQGAQLGGINAGQPFNLVVAASGNNVKAWVNGRRGLGPNGVTGIPTPANGGHLGFFADTPNNPLTIDYVIARDENGPLAQLTEDTRGIQSLVLFRPDFIFNFDINQLTVSVDNVAIPGPFFGLFFPYIWPTPAGFDFSSHIILTSENAAVPATPGMPFWADYAGQRDGLFYR